jgi:hypothetical protein
LRGLVLFMDYATPSKRKSKNDKRAKGRFNKYKKGGANRVSGIKIRNSN